MAKDFTPQPAGAEPPAKITVSAVGEYVRHRSCPRRFKLDMNKRVLGRRLPFAERLFNPLDVVLSAGGKERENLWEAELAEAGYAALVTRVPEAVDSAGPPEWSEFADALEALDSAAPAYGREVRVTGQLGIFRVEGRADFILLVWRDGNPVLRVVECKASRRDRTYQRLQVCFYVLLIKQYLRHRPLTVANRLLEPSQVEGVVARIDAETNAQQRILDLDALDLSLETADAMRLVADDGTLAQIARSDLDDLAFQIDAKCDGCVFSVDCLPEAARQRRVELLGIPTSVSLALRRAGILTVDNLADLTAEDPRAREVRGDPGFTDSLDRLAALARARRATLPGVDGQDDFPVAQLPHGSQSQLPEHEQGGDRLVRVFLAVDYDYTENRIGALTAHVTRSDGQLHCAWKTDGTGRSAPDPDLVERWRGVDESSESSWDVRPLTDVSVVDYQSSEWSGEYLADTGSERQIIQSFLHSLIEAIAEVAGEPQARLHFYVWSRSEMTHLVEACTRTSSRLLAALRELLGCRPGQEQLIFSSLQEEVDRRYGLGWTGRGLTVASSLPWFGRRYHWRRRVVGQEVDLDRVFEQDIFDFKTDLELDANGGWSTARHKAHVKHKFEIRSRFHDSLPAPYWRAIWDTLPDPDAAAVDMDAATRSAIRRYLRAAEPGLLKAYLTARVHALRWIEEGVRYKNSDIDKPALTIADLRRFTLGINDVAAAGVDFLRIDHFVSTTNWVSTNLQPPAVRVPAGRTLPLRDVVADGHGGLTATIDLTGYGLDLDTLKSRCPYGEGSFCRVSPCAEDPNRGQTIGQLMRGGFTVVVRSIDWVTGTVTMESRYSRESRYLLSSRNWKAGPAYSHATLDESPSDFVAGRVERRLEGCPDSHIYAWFDPERPQVPPQEEFTDAAAMRRALQNVVFDDGRGLTDDQQSAIGDGLDTRIQLLQGPPGTGKTQTTAAALLVRAAARLAPGALVVVAAHTHTAVDTLLSRIVSVEPALRRALEDAGMRLPDVRVGKVYTTAPASGSGMPSVEVIAAGAATRQIQRLSAGGLLVLGGTTGALLKLAENLDGTAAWSRNGGFRTPLLVVDEASMMVLPHFLTLATLVSPDGNILLAGDHRQLEPIMAHDWEHEDRPPAVVYQPFSSAFNAVRYIAAHQAIHESQIRRSALRSTFRLPPLITDVIARLYALDEIELQSLKKDEPIECEDEQTAGSIDRAWEGKTGLYLVLHGERESRQSNAVEVTLVQQLIEANPSLPPASVAVITPHRAQRAMLATALAEHPAVDLVDTVERLQGGERPTVLVCGTASDPAAIAANARFLLDLNRSNVAFSRAQERLIVICARSLLDALPADLEDYQSAMLWKSLRAICTRRVGGGVVAGHPFEVLTVPLDPTAHLPPLEDAMTLPTPT